MEYLEHPSFYIISIHTLHNINGEYETPNSQRNELRGAQ